MNQDIALINRWLRTVGHAHVSVLRWHRSVGYARHHGVSLDMREPPPIPGSDIEYLPGCYTIDGRPMALEERDEIRRRLVQMRSGACDGLYGRLTLAVVGDVG